MMLDCILTRRPRDFDRGLFSLFETLPRQPQAWIVDWATATGMKNHSTNAEWQQRCALWHSGSVTHRSPLLRFCLCDRHISGSKG